LETDIIHMIATVSLDSLLSGLIGVFVGGFLSWFIAWWIALNNAKDTLMGKLLVLKSYHLFEIGNKKSDNFQKFRETYPDILIAVLTYRKLLLKSFRPEIDNAFCYYRLGKKSEELKDNPMFQKYSHVDVSGEFDFEQRIDKLLQAIDEDC